MKKSDKNVVLSVIQNKDDVRTVCAENVLEALRHFPVNQLDLKGRVVLRVDYDGNRYERLWNIPRVRRLINNDITKQVVAKFINQVIQFK